MRVPTPAALRPAPRTAPEPIDAASAEAGAFGRVDADGTVHLRTPEGDVVVGHGTPQMLRPAFSQYGARSLRLKILPESSRGSAALNSTTRGTL